jgi:hypothetical protein
MDAAVVYDLTTEALAEKEGLPTSKNASYSVKTAIPVVEFCFYSHVMTAAMDGHMSVAINLDSYKRSANPMGALSCIQTVARKLQDRGFWVAIPKTWSLRMDVAESAVIAWSFNARKIAKDSLSEWQKEKITLMEGWIIHNAHRGLKWAFFVFNRRKPMVDKMRLVSHFAAMGFFCNLNSRVLKVYWGVHERNTPVLEDGTNNLSCAIAWYDIKLRRLDGTEFWPNDPWEASNNKTGYPRSTRCPVCARHGGSQLEAEEQNQMQLAKAEESEVTA